MAKKEAEEKAAKETSQLHPPVLPKEIHSSIPDPDQDQDDEWVRAECPISDCEDSLKKSQSSVTVTPSSTDIPTPLPQSEVCSPLSPTSPTVPSTTANPVAESSVKDNDDNDDNDEEGRNDDDDCQW